MDRRVKALVALIVQCIRCIGVIEVFEPAAKPCNHRSVKSYVSVEDGVAGGDEQLGGDPYILKTRREPTVDQNPTPMVSVRGKKIPQPLGTKD